MHASPTGFEIVLVTTAVAAGDTLVVDTVGFNDKTFVDSYRTPRSDKLHVVERFRLIDGGDTLEVAFAVEDPGAYYQPCRGHGTVTA
jgi:hypothetical protein